MTKDEMKDRISMALKDPVLQQGFEVICKNLAELENACKSIKNDNNCPDVMGETNNGTVIALMQLSNKLVSKTQQLNKAKKLIRELISSLSVVGECELLNRAEQFLNSEVE